MALTIFSVSKVQSNAMTFYLALLALSGHVRLAYDTGVWILTCWCLSERWYEVCVHSWVFLFSSLRFHIVFVLLEAAVVMRRVLEALVRHGSLMRKTSIVVAGLGGSNL